MRFIHTADWQIGMRATHVGAAGVRVRNARLETARRVVQLAKDQQADFLLIAGDTFEDNAVDRVLIQKVADILAAAQRPVYLIPGNHDPFVPGSVWHHVSWTGSANLRVLTEAQPVELSGGTLYPCPLFEKHSNKDPTAWIHADDTDGIAIGVSHGSVPIGTSDPLDYPIAREAATRCGLDYLALGHYHSAGSYPDAAGVVRMGYAGTHETRDTKVTAVVDFYGPADYAKLAEARRDHPERFNMATINRHAANGGGIHFFGAEQLDAAGLAKLRAVSPMAAVHKGMAPFLCIHGNKDDQVSYKQSPTLCEAMHKVGAGCELITIENGGHGMGGWLAPEMQHWKPEMIAWLKKTLAVK